MMGNCCPARGHTLLVCPCVGTSQLSILLLQRIQLLTVMVKICLACTVSESGIVWRRLSSGPVSPVVEERLAHCYTQNSDA